MYLLACDISGRVMHFEVVSDSVAQRASGCLWLPKIVLVKPRTREAGLERQLTVGWTWK
jgi:hypothetical protein